MDYDKKDLLYGILLALIIAGIALSFIVLFRPDPDPGPSCSIERITDLDDGRQYKVFKQRSDGKIIKIEEITEK